jgi:hypothetical protein
MKGSHLTESSEQVPTRCIVTLPQLLYYITHASRDSLCSIADARMFGLTQDMQVTFPVRARTT